MNSEKIIIDTLFTKIQPFFDSIIQNIPITKLELNKYYSLVYTTCEDIIIEHDYLLSKIETFIKTFFENSFKKLMETKEKDLFNLPIEIQQIIFTWKSMKTMINFVFSTIQFCPHQKIDYTLKSLLKNSFRKFYKEMLIEKMNLFDILIKMISQTRFDKKMSTENFEAIHCLLEYHFDENLAYNIQVFQRSFIDQTVKDFQLLKEEIKSIPIDQTLKRLGEIVDKERNFVMKGLLKSIIDELNDLIQDKLVAELSEKVKENFIQMINDKKKSELTTFSLLWNERNEMKEFSLLLKEFLSTRYKESYDKSIKNPLKPINFQLASQFVLNHLKFIEELKSDYFKHSNLLVETINDTFKDLLQIEILINNQPKPIETIVVSYLNAMLTKSNSTNMSSYSRDTKRLSMSFENDTIITKSGQVITNVEDYLFKKIKKVVEIVNYLPSPDSFFILYQRMLLKRIVQRVIAYDSLEQKTIDELYSINNSSESRKLKKMFTEYVASISEVSSFNRNEISKMLNIQSEILVFSSYMLESHEAHQNIFLVKELEHIWNYYKTEYLNQHERRKIFLDHSLSSVVIDYSIPTTSPLIPAKQYKLTMSYIQYLIIYFLSQAYLENKKSMKVRDLYQKICPRYDGFLLQLNTLINCKILKYSTNETSLDVLEHSVEFALTEIKETFLLNKLTKSRMVNKGHKENEITSSHERMLNACMCYQMKLMKREKRMAYNSLIDMTLNQFKGKFNITTKIIRQSIENLMENEYFIRDENDNEIIIYQP